jgi:hypothetical protein
MYRPVATKDLAAVELEVQAAYLAVFPQGDPRFVPLVFGWAVEWFTGKYSDYQAVDARYHDFEHTLQGTLCMARLLRGRHSAGAQPLLTPRLFQLGLLAILLHDTGYLKKRSDTQGTGAKYTATHVGRSADFAAQLLADKGFPPVEIRAVQNMIRCTGVNANLDAIAFQSELERVLGCALGTADLLGQMAADDYIAKLPILYEELAEAARHAPENPRPIARFASAEDLMRKTPLFWENSVQAKLANELGGLCRFLNDPYPSGPNEYLDRIQANIERLKSRIAAPVARVQGPGSATA